MISSFLKPTKMATLAFKNIIRPNNFGLNRFLSISVHLQQQQQSNQKTSQKYRFTYHDANGKLSEEQRDFYEKNGFLVIKKLIPDQDLDRYWQRFQDIADGKVKPSPLMILQKDISQAKEQLKEVTLYKVQELYADDVLFEYCKHPNILDYVEAFVGSPNIMAIHSMLINKPPDTGSKSSRHPMHQDLLYFPLRPADRIVASWTAMEKINRDNGCLSAIPGSHMGELLKHDYPEWEGGVNKLYFGIQDLPEELNEKRVHLEMERGDCAFFHPLLIHGSGVNRTKGFRKAISCHYASATDTHYIDVKGTLQEKLAGEILEIFKKKSQKLGGEEVDITYADLWKLRSRLVRGKDSDA